jgi:hypothetical protein
MVLHMSGRIEQLDFMLEGGQRVRKPGGRIGVLKHAGYDQLPPTHPTRRLPLNGLRTWLITTAFSAAFCSS